MAALFVCTEQTLIDILLAFTDRNDMIKKDKKPWQMETDGGKKSAKARTKEMRRSTAKAVHTVGQLIDGVENMLK